MPDPLAIASVTFWPPPPDDPDDDDRAIRLTRDKDGEIGTVHAGTRSTRLTLPYRLARDVGLAPAPPRPWHYQIDPETPVRGWNVLVSCTAQHLADHPDTDWDADDVPADPWSSPVVVGVGPAMATVYTGTVTAGADRDGGPYEGHVYDLTCDPAEVRVLR